MSFSSIGWAQNPVSNAAKSIIDPSVIYDGSYQSIAYPNGDVAADRGVCSDVIVRAYRTLNIDLQSAVHNDMRTHFNAYPSQRMWGLSKPDKNIDHRRVPNLETFLTRQGASLPITKNPDNYKAGDIVSWRLHNGLPHIGIVIDERSQDKKRPLVVHNIGQGQIAEDVLFEWKIVGHFRYLPK
ncbi:MAG: DUF1287 domain-containing protein [Xanthomonadaceae bacterium]|nr:DUF1287 domain-containing protein [Xanthomonadaceae bacterium]